MSAEVKPRVGDVDVRLVNVTKMFGDQTAVDGITPVSYTHLTLPTKA